MAEAAAVRPVVRQRVAQRKRARRRAMTMQLAFTGVALVVLVALVWVGWRSAMRITGGVDEVVTDPDAPGYVAEVRPTGVTLVAVTGELGELISMLLVVDDQGSESVTAASLSPQLTLWDFEDSPPISAAEVFADGGIDSLRLRLGAELSFGTTEALVVPGSALVELASRTGPVTIDLVDDVFFGAPDTDPSDVVLQYPSGELTVEPDEVDDFLAFIGYREPDTNRALRSGSLWSALLDGLGEVPSATALGDGEDVGGFAELLAAMTDGDLELEVVPMTPVTLYVDPPVTIHRIDTESMPTWAAAHVPFPVAAFPGQLATVAILDGTGDPAAISTVSPRIVAMGAEVALTGNAESAEVDTSRVEYGRTEASAAAERIARALDVSAIQVEDQRSDVDVTVVVGKDLLR